MSYPKYIINQVNNEEVDLLINGEIDAWWATGLAEVNQMLANSGASKINLQINSPGGSVFEGLAIAALIKSFPATINTTVIGLAASIATPIALAGQKVMIDKDSFFMIHNPWSFAAGESDDLRETADLLDSIKDQLANIYLDKIKATGNLINNRADSTLKQVNEWMNNETWFTASQALEAGLVDEIVDRKTKEEKEDNKLKAQSILNSCKNFKNAPVEFLNKFQTIVDMKDKEETIKEEDNTFFDKLKSYFISNPKEVKDLIDGLDEDVLKAEEDEVSKALELLKAKGTFKIEEVKAEETEEETEKVVEETTEEEPSELETIKAEMKALKESNEAQALKLQKIEEEKNAGPSAGGDKPEAKTDDKKSIEKLYAPTEDHKTSLDAMAKIFN